MRRFKNSNRRYDGFSESDGMNLDLNTSKSESRWDNPTWEFVRDFGFILVCIAAMICLVVYACYKSADTSDARAIHAAETQGFTHVKVLDKHYFVPQWYGCGHDDDLGWDIEATNPIGQRVQLIVCAGFWMKGATVRSK